MEVGLLINFGGRSLQFKRVHNNGCSKIRQSFLIRRNPRFIQEKINLKLISYLCAHGDSTP